MIKRLLVLLILFIALPCAATDYYIDPDCGTPGDGTSPTCSGTSTDPFDEWSDFTVTNGNDYRQKCGTSYTGVLSITNSGSSGNRIIIGAYNADDSHEDGGNEVFGENCSGGSAKPIIIDSDLTGNAISIVADYIELNSIQAKKGETTITINGSDNYVQYCRVMDALGGIRVGNTATSDDNYVGYNYFYGDDPTPGDANDLDGIQFGSYTNSSIAEYNYINEHAHSGIRTSSSASYNEIRYNSVYNTGDMMDQFLEIRGDNNNYHHNYCSDCGKIQLYGAESNIIQYNIMDGLTSNSYIASAAGAIELQPLVAVPGAITDNKIYNNIVYDRQDGWSNPIGANMMCKVSGTGVIERNEFVNNIFLNFAGTGATLAAQDNLGSCSNKIESDPSDPDVNIWRNNLVYGSVTNPAYIEGTYYSSMSNFNSSYNAAYNNSDSDPGLEDAANSEFWPASESSNVVGNGYDNGTTYDDLWDPDSSDLTTSPITVVTELQPTNWIIGVYGISGVESQTLPIQGILFNGIKIN